MAAVFEFAETWHLAERPERIRDVLLDLERYPEWWPQVRGVWAIGDDDARVRCRSTLPYTLDLRLHAVCRDLPTLEVDVSGDLSGWVRWSLLPAAGGTRLEFRQRVTVTGLLRLAAPARPLLRWNHHRMMAGCRAGLVNRLNAAPAPRRRRAPGA